MQILLIFGGTTALYTMFGGLMGVVVTEILHFAILMVGGTAFVFFAVAQHGGWAHILQRIAATRPEALAQIPPVMAATPENSIEMLTIVILVLQGIFFAGSPTAGEGSTAQRFMAARNEGHAMAGQLFNCFLALTLRIAAADWHRAGGAVALLAGQLGANIPPPEGMTVIHDPVHAWAESDQALPVAAGFCRPADLDRSGGLYVHAERPDQLGRQLRHQRHLPPLGSQRLGEARDLGQPADDAGAVCRRPASWPSCL